MADEIDLAIERAELARAAAATLRRPEGPPANGRCHYCDEIVGDSQKYCDNWCASSHEQEQRRLRSIGRSR